MKNVLILFISILLASGCTNGQQARNQATGEAFWLDGKWPHEKSVIPPDERPRYGRLANGVRYVIQKNTPPGKRVGVYLSVQAGSMMEKPNELGIAHYLEHMAFNGSEHFPPGTLVSFFQKNGMRFGRDANAYTKRQETAYLLNLASAEKTHSRRSPSGPARHCRRPDPP